MSSGGNFTFVGPATFGAGGGGGGGGKLLVSVNSLVPLGLIGGGGPIPVPVPAAVIDTGGNPILIMGMFLVTPTAGVTIIPTLQAEPMIDSLSIGPTLATTFHDATPLAGGAGPPFITLSHSVTHPLAPGPHTFEYFVQQLPGGNSLTMIHHTISVIQLTP